VGNVLRDFFSLCKNIEHQTLVCFLLLTSIYMMYVDKRFYKKKTLFQCSEIMSLGNIYSGIQFFVDLLKYTYSDCLKVT
jgi:hypothetical protein